MANVEIKMRFNPETDEVETLVDGKVLVSSGSDAFASWANYYVEKHKTVEEPVEEKKVVEEDEKVDVDHPVEEEKVDLAEEVDKPKED